MKRVRNLLIILGIVALCLFPLWDLTRPGLPVTHDGQDHVARISNFYTSLSEGNIVPRWASKLNWGYGHPILMFLYPLPSYVASVLHAVGFSFVDGTKLVFATAFILSAVTMYIWASYAWGTYAGITASILYIFAPYRYVDLYVRGAIGEHMAFVFPPLICYGLLRLARDKSGFSAAAIVIIALATALLILSHNALSLMFLSIIGLYALVVSKYEAKNPSRFIVTIGFAFLSGLLLSAFYWVPGFFEGKYTLRDIVTAGDFKDRFVPWLSFVYSPWSFGGGNELSKWLGAGQLLVLIMSFYGIEKNPRFQRLIIGCLLLLLFFLFIMTKSSESLWRIVTLLQKFQFPWRFLSVTTFLTAIIGALVTASWKKGLLLMVLISSVSIVSTIPMWRAKEYKLYNEFFFTDIYNSTTDTGESSPIWSVRFMESRPVTEAFVWPPNGSITPTFRNTTKHSYMATITENSRFVENTLYFPGWKVFINNEQLPPDKLIFQDPMYRGLMTFDITPGTYDIRFVFTDTKLRKAANYISIGTMVVFILSIGTMQLLWRKRE